MHAPNNNIAPKGLRGWWTSPARSGMQLIISPWRRYSHLRWERLEDVRVDDGVPGRGRGKLAFAYWELSIARSAAART